MRLLVPGPVLTTVALFITAPALAHAHDWNGLARDSHGNLFVVDAEDGYVWKVAPDGRATTFVSGDAGEPLNHPHHLAIDEHDRLWLGSG
jgi:sugar lactone lactonase YvrE